MAVSGRRLLALGAGAAAGGFGPVGCGTQRSLGDADEITLWTWDRSVSDELVARAETKGIPGAEDYRLSRTNIGGHFNTKVRTALVSKSLVPDIIGINSDVATYFPNQDVLVDLNDFGAAELKSRYLDWKWNECITPEGRMIAFPMDTGPTGLFYRTDLLPEAGITTDPKEVAARAPDWDGFIALGKELQKSRERAVICPNIRHVWSIRLGQLASRFMTEDGRYVGDRDELREAFEPAYRIGRDATGAGAAVRHPGLARLGRLAQGADHPRCGQRVRDLLDAAVRAGGDRRRADPGLEGRRGRVLPPVVDGGAAGTAPGNGVPGDLHLLPHLERLSVAADRDDRPGQGDAAGGRAAAERRLHHRPVDGHRRSAHVGDPADRGLPDRLAPLHRQPGHAAP